MSRTFRKGYIAHIQHPLAIEFYLKSNPRALLCCDGALDHWKLPTKCLEAKLQRRVGMKEISAEINQHINDILENTIYESVGDYYNRMEEEYQEWLETENAWIEEDDKIWEHEDSWGAEDIYRTEYNKGYEKGKKDGKKDGYKDGYLDAIQYMTRKQNGWRG